MLSATVEELSLGEVSFYDVADHFSGRPGFVLLDSQGSHEHLGQYSFLSFSPFAGFRIKGDVSVFEDGTRRDVVQGDPLGELQRALDRYAVDKSDAGALLPFHGGAIGYFAYDLGRQIEILPNHAADDLRLPDCFLGFYNFTVVWSHAHQRMFLAHLGGVPRGLSREEVVAELRQVRPRTTRVHRPSGPVHVDTAWFRTELTETEYLTAVHRIREYIYAGDVYQVNMTQRFHVAIGETSPWTLSRALADLNPAPFAAYLNLDGHAIVSSSPERFLRIRQRRIETRPIKGTIRRGRDHEEDLRNRAVLVASVKNRAELAMIVDLLRNDLGRVCAPGSVRVDGFPQLESYASLHHLVATIVGDLEEHRTFADVIKATFPGGSITGAPKIRAMEIIDELEPVARGVYTGSIGYVGFDGDVDLNIAIRTIIVKDRHAYVHAGGGIVADSVPDEERDELFLKASRLLQAIQATVLAEGSRARLF